MNYAGFWGRVAAYSIDSLILDVPFYVLLLLAIFAGGSGFRRRLAPGTDFPGPQLGMFAGIFIVRLLILMAVFFVVHWLYFAAMESSARQATLGKSAMSLRVTDMAGQRLTFGHASGRYLAKFISSIIPLGIGYILAGFTLRKQALHDMIAGTLSSENNL